MQLVTETMRTAGVKIKDCDLAISISAVTATDTLTKVCYPARFIVCIHAVLIFSTYHLKYTEHIMKH